MKMKRKILSGIITIVFHNHNTAHNNPEFYVVRTSDTIKIFLIVQSLLFPTDPPKGSWNYSINIGDWNEWYIEQMDKVYFTQFLISYSILFRRINIPQMNIMEIPKGYTSYLHLCCIVNVLGIIKQFSVSNLIII